MLAILVTYWPVLLLLHVPRLANAVAVMIATRVKGKLDHRIPDDLPITAGEWLGGRLVMLRMGVTAIVTDKHDDAYRPGDKLIQLHDTTHFKADPVYWATAAHELGHARIRAELPAIGHLRQLSFILMWPLCGIGIASLAAYVLYASELGNRIAFACFAVAAALKIFVLIDEAVASILAYRELYANTAIDFTHLRAIRAVLVTAFLTYLVTYGSYALLLTQWSLLDSLVLPASHAELTTFGWIMAGLLSAASVIAWLFDRGSARWLPIVFLIALVWNVIDPAYTWCVVAAVLGSWPAWQRVAHLPFCLPFAAAGYVIGKLDGPGVDKTPVYLRRRKNGAREVRAGNDRIAKLLARWEHRLHPVDRVFSYARLAYLPLLIAIWL